MIDTAIKAYHCPTNNNFGDIFTEYLFSRLLGITLIQSEPPEARLLGCGSIMEIAEDGLSRSIFGTGVQYEGTQFDLRSSQVYALRGFLTKYRCETYDNPVLGDPVLLSYILAERSQKIWDLGIIPHEVDQDDSQVKEWAELSDVLIIDILGGVNYVLSAIASCRTIVSSCLHGLVAADSLEIPNQWIELSDRVCGKGFKFRDYYSLFDLDPQPWHEIAMPTDPWFRKGIWAIKRDLLRAAATLAKDLINERDRH